MSETNMQDPAKLFQQYLDKLIEMGIKPTPAIMVALAKRSASEVKSEAKPDQINGQLQDGCPGEEEESIDALPEQEPAPGRNIGREVWGWKWMLKAAAAGIWIWFSWYNVVIVWHLVLAVIGAIAALVYITTAVMDVVEGERKHEG